MVAIMKDTGSRWLVRAKAGEWVFETYEEAQKKANDEMFKEAKDKGLL